MCRSAPQILAVSARRRTSSVAPQFVLGTLREPQTGRCVEDGRISWRFHDSTAV